MYFSNSSYWINNVTTKQILYLNSVNLIYSISKFIKKNGYTALGGYYRRVVKSCKLQKSHDTAVFFEDFYEMTSNWQATSRCYGRLAT